MRFTPNLLSRILNVLSGGRFEQTLCARVAEKHGVECAFCRLVAVLVEPDHCAAELARWWTRK